ncbi:Radical SAM domain protein [uncultured Paludibacter sp.]|nr:Radical SAM domain protein [uncultured Paludibacter sp.]
MQVNEFRVIAEKIKPFTDYVYLHVLGEPLLHPQLEEILKICKEKGLLVNISTNGSLLEKHKDIFLQNSVRQMNISLHDVEENIPKEKWSDFIQNTLQISKELSAKTYINLRLWNKTNAESEEFNALCYNLIMKEFNFSENLNLNHNKKNITLADNIYLQNAPRFKWQSENATENKTCYALKDHIAILANGEVVPCCIDAEANLLLGNIFKEDLSVILQSEKANRIKNGFAKHKAVEDYCKKCGFRIMD